MHALFSILLFCLWKGTEYLALHYGVTLLHLRSNSLFFPFYFVLSAFQLVFVFWNLFITARKKKSLFLISFSPLVLFMESIIFITSLGILYTLGNSIFRLLLISLFILPVYSVFFIFQEKLNRILIGQEKIYILNLPKFPLFIPILFNLLIPLIILYILFFFKYPSQPVLTPIAPLWILAISVFVWFFQILDRISLSKNTAKQLKQLSPFLIKPVIHPLAINEIGWIQQQLQDYEERKKLTYHDKTFITQYLSEDIKKSIIKKGIPSKAQKMLATVSTIRFEVHIHPTEESLLTDTPSDPIEILDKIIKMVGDYAEQYQAYPVFSHNQIHLIFGAPVYFEHLNYHALECSTQILHDLGQMHSEVIQIKKHCGIIHGDVYMGALHSRGKDYTELQFCGEALLNSEKLANAAYQSNISLLANEACIKGLKTKFFVEKNYKIKIGEEELVACKIRV